MPDLKSELMKLDNLKFDDDVSTVSDVVIDEVQQNVNRELWELVKLHPASTSAELSDISGMNANTVSIRLAQMFNRGYLIRAKNLDGKFRYTTAGDLYEGLRNKKSKAAKPVRTPKTTKLSASRKQVEPANPTPSFDLNSMSIRQARALYDELKVIFGG